RRSPSSWQCSMRASSTSRSRRSGDAFGARPAQTQWVVLAYLLAVSSLVLPAGAWLATAGPRAALLFAAGAAPVNVPRTLDRPGRVVVLRHVVDGPLGRWLSTSPLGLCTSHGAASVAR